MPGEFLTNEQRESYGKFSDELTDEQIAKYFMLDDKDKIFIFSRRGKHNQLGIAIQLCTVRFLGTFLLEPIDIPLSIIKYISNQLKIEEFELSKYKDSRIRWNHTCEISSKYGYSNFSTQPQHWRLVRWLYSRAWLGTEKPIVLFDLVTNRCVEQKILLPGVTTLERLVAQIYELTSKKLWKKLYLIPNSTEKNKLLELLNVNSNNKKTNLDNLRHPPNTISPNGIVKALERLKSIRFLGACGWNISKIPLGKIRKLSKYAAIARSQIISRMPEEKKIAHLIAFAIDFSVKSQDDIIYMLDKYLAELFKRTTNKGDKNKLKKSKNLSSSIRKILSAVEILLDNSTPDKQIRNNIYEKVTEQDLKKAYKKINSLTDSLESNISFHELFQNYSSVRRFLPKLLEMIDFQATSSGKDILKILNFIIEQEGRKHKKFYKNVPDISISKEWEKVVVKDNTKVYACGYTFWFLNLLFKAIKNREIYILGSDNYGNPEAQLIQGTMWESLKRNIIHTTKWSNSPGKSLNPLIEELDNAFKYTESRLKNNTYVNFEKTMSGKSRLVLSPLKRREEFLSYKVLKNRIQEILPTIDLPVLLLEVNKWTNFFDCFTHINGGKSRVSDIDISICAVMIAKACNIGFKPVSQKGIPALEYDRLTWIEQNYFTPENIMSARIRLNKFHIELYLSQKWGKGEIASADGKRLIVAVKSITSGYNSNFFGVRKGITNYSLISDMFDELNFLLEPGATKDSIYLPQCVLEQETALKPKEIMTDTGGYSDLVFGIFGLLEYQFSPRIADIGSSRFWRIDKNADYGMLNDLSKNRINLNLIYEKWDDMLRVMASLKLGSVNATNLIRMLQRSGRPTLLGRAIIQFGRIYKTLYQLTYIDDPDYRRTILTQLNKGESRNGLTDVVNYGKKGELYQPYQIGQEEQLGALGLVVNAIVHWNTRYMEVALDLLRKEGLNINEEDVKHLSPLIHDHLNIVGNYSFIVPKEIEKGHLRVLRIPEKPFGKI
jgi:TnpA family transposase